MMSVHVIHSAGPGVRRTRTMIIAAPDVRMARTLAETLRPGWRAFAAVAVLTDPLSPLEAGFQLSFAGCAGLVDRIAQNSPPWPVVLPLFDSQNLLFTCKRVAG